MTDKVQSYVNRLLERQHADDYKPKPTVAGLLAEAAADIKPVVDAIERSPMTSQNHYADYMAALSRFEGTSCMVAGVAMVMAGGSKAGVYAALKALGKIT